MSNPTTNRDQIIAWALKAGFDSHDMSADFTCNLNDIERFAALVAAAEREKCSKTKAATPRKLKRVGTGALLHMQQEHFEMGWREGAKSVRDAIRARGETK